MPRSIDKNDVSVETTPLLDPSDDEDQENWKIDSKQLWVLPALAIGCFLSAADQTIVFSSYGEIGNELHALHKASWLATAYGKNTTPQTHFEPSFPFPPSPPFSKIKTTRELTKANILPPGIYSP